MQNLCLSNGIAWQYVTEARRILHNDITGAYANKKPTLKPLPEVHGYKFNPESDQLDQLRKQLLSLGLTVPGLTATSETPFDTDAAATDTTPAADEEAKVYEVLSKLQAATEGKQSQPSMRWMRMVAS